MHALVGANVDLEALVAGAVLAVMLEAVWIIADGEARLGLIALDLLSSIATFAAAPTAACTAIARRKHIARSGHAAPALARACSISASACAMPDLVSVARVGKLGSS